ncbi:MAG: hypothetical protein JXR65_06480 [Bacteroidales bacterium]|nr:hypothetical protein [Bacteroidales bacterium]
MRIIQTSAYILFLLFSLQLSAQDYVDVKLGETKSNNTIEVNFSGVKKKTKKDEDYYRVTLTVTNLGPSWSNIFTTAVKNYIKSDKSAVAEVNFLNATGRGMSATTGKLFGNQITIQVPFKCKKCPAPKKKDEDPYNHYVETYVIGTEFLNGSSVFHSFSIRVPAGAIPDARVMLK